MLRLLQLIGTMVFFCAWPAFFVYFRLGGTRTRIVLVNNNQVLVMKQWISPGKWNLPGGGVHKGENIDKAAVRELHEETGIDLDHTELKALGFSDCRMYGLLFRFKIYAAEIKTTELKRQRVELSELTWISSKDLTPSSAGPDTIYAIKLSTAQGCTRN